MPSQPSPVPGAAAAGLVTGEGPGCDLVPTVWWLPASQLVSLVPFRRVSFQLRLSGCSQKPSPCSRLYEISSRGSGARPQGHPPFLPGRTLTASPASWQAPASLLHKGLIGNTELGEPREGPSRDNPLSHHHQSLPWQGSPRVTPSHQLRSSRRFAPVSDLYKFPGSVCSPSLVVPTSRGQDALRDRGPCSARAGGGSRQQPHRAHRAQASAKPARPALVHQSAAVFSFPLGQQRRLRCWDGAGDCSVVTSDALVKC